MTNERKVPGGLGWYIASVVIATCAVFAAFVIPMGGDHLGFPDGPAATTTWIFALVVLAAGAWAAFATAVTWRQWVIEIVAACVAAYLQWNLLVLAMWLLAI